MLDRDNKMHAKYCVFILIKSKHKNAKLPAGG